MRALRTLWLLAVASGLFVTTSVRADNLVGGGPQAREVVRKKAVHITDSLS